jgi:hypothetical protein
MVKILGTQLGYADVRLVSNGTQAKINNDDVITLIDGRTLPIKFRIELGAVGIVASGGGTVTLNSGEVSVALAAGAVSEPVAITATPIDTNFFNYDRSVIPGTFYEFQPSPISFGAPATLSLAIPAVLPSSTSLSRLAICKFSGIQRVWHY